MSFFLAPFQAISYLNTHRHLWRYIAIPTGITAVVTGLSVGFLTRWFHDVVATIVTADSVLWYIVLIFSTVAVVIVSFYFFIIFLNLLSGPFNDVLSEVVEAQERGGVQKISHRSFSLASLIKEYGRTITAEIARLVVFGIIIVGMVILVVVAAGPLVGVINGCIAVFFVVFEFLDYSLSRHGFTFVQKVKFVFAHAGQLFVYGLGMLLFAAIPVLNLLIIPVGVISATQVMVALAHNTESK